MISGFITNPLGKKSGHILLVEDDQIIASTETRLLKKLGYSVTQVSTGEAAISAMDSSPETIDLILMDINLGESLDGTATARVILASHDVPILFLSGVTEPDTIDRTDDVLSYGYVVKGSGIAVLDASIKMAFRLHRAGKELKSRERGMLLLTNAMESVKNAVAISGPDARLLYVNPYFMKIWGYDDRNDVIGKSAALFWEEHEKAAFVAQLVLSRGSWAGELTALRRDGAKFNVDVVTSLVRDDKNEPAGIVALFTDNTARRSADESIRESEERYRDIFENALEGIYQTTPEGRYLNINPAFARMFGYSSPEEMIVSINDIGKQIYVDSGSRERLKALLGEKGFVENYEAQVYRKDGTKFWISINAHVVRDDKGNTHHFEGTNIDITERKLSAVLLEKSVKEKEVLLKELQHRVKNNLNVIAGLLFLESENIHDENGKAVFMDAISRINSMSGIYEKLYISSDFDRISLSSYIDSLAEAICSTYHIKNNRIDLKINSADIILDLKRTVPLGLILNELITNSLKYAYTGSDGGEIRVDLSENEGVIILSVSDDGAGVTGDSGGEGGSTMGLNLVKMIAEQISGTVEITSGKGMTVEVKFNR